jgi:hypothetical protein
MQTMCAGLLAAVIAIFVIVPAQLALSTPHCLSKLVQTSVAAHRHTLSDTHAIAARYRYKQLLMRQYIMYTTLATHIA